MTIVHRLYRFKGRVQGVGFRFTAMHYAQQLGLSGWVKNEWDHSVTMEVQGSDNRVVALINHLCSDTYIRVDSVTFEEMPISNDLRGFGVKGY